MAGGGGKTADDVSRAGVAGGGGLGVVSDGDVTNVREVANARDGVIVALAPHAFRTSPDGTVTAVVTRLIFRSGRRECRASVDGVGEVTLKLPGESAVGDEVRLVFDPARATLVPAAN